MKLRVLCVIIFGLIVLSCKQNDKTNLGELHYFFSAGSMPPPYHYEYEIIIDNSGKGEYIFYPDYPGMDENMPVWKEEFTVEQSYLDSLVSLIFELEFIEKPLITVDEPPVGGSYDRLSFFINEDVTKVPSFVIKEDQERRKKVVDTVLSLVPSEIKLEMHQKYENYANSRLK